MGSQYFKCPIVVFGRRLIKVNLVYHQKISPKNWYKISAPPLYKCLRYRFNKFNVRQKVLTLLN